MKQPGPNILKKESLQRPLKSDIKELSLIVYNTPASLNRYLQKGLKMIENKCFFALLIIFIALNYVIL